MSVGQAAVEEEPTDRPRVSSPVVVGCPQLRDRTWILEGLILLLSFHYHSNSYLVELLLTEKEVIAQATQSNYVVGPQALVRAMHDSLC